MEINLRRIIQYNKDHGWKTWSHAQVVKRPRRGEVLARIQLHHIADIVRIGLQLRLYVVDEGIVTGIPEVNDVVSPVTQEPFQLKRSANNA